jgi:hypothetical protein
MCSTANRRRAWRVSAGARMPRPVVGLAGLQTTGAAYRGSHDESTDESMGHPFGAALSHHATLRCPSMRVCLTELRDEKCTNHDLPQNVMAVTSSTSSETLRLDGPASKPAVQTILAPSQVCQAWGHLFGSQPEGSVGRDTSRAIDQRLCARGELADPTRLSELGHWPTETPQTA